MFTTQVGIIMDILLLELKNTNNYENIYFNEWHSI